MSRVLYVVVFMLIAIAVLGSMHWYLWTRFVRDAQLGVPWRQIVTYAAVVMFVLLIATPLTYRLTDGKIPHAAVTLIYCWMGFITIALAITGGLDIVRLIALKAHAMAVAEPLDPSRRMLFSRIFGGVALLSAMGASVMAARTALGSPRLRRVKVTLRKLPKAFDKVSVVQISDLHVGPTIRREFVRDIVDRTNALNPDIIVITGDLVDGPVHELKDDVAPIADLKARLGVFFVTGNHEYYSGVQAWMEHLPSIGVHVLRNESVRLGELLYLAGVDDWTAHQFGHGHGADLDKALQGIPDDAEVILLAHQPKQVITAAKRNVGLVLSGHTHGGQIWPFGIFVRLAQPYVAGLADHEGTQIYVSRGTGFWGPPMRFGAPSELTHIELNIA